jgi:hypothetical protein
MKSRFSFVGWLVLLAGFISCTKENIIVVPDNEPVSYTNISRLKIENYVNRLYIDLVGREPLKSELTVEADSLQSRELKREARVELIEKLMSDTTFREGESSYRAAFYLNLYNLAKVRCLEGVSDEEINQNMGILRFGARIDSLESNWDAYYKKQEALRRYQHLLDAQQHLLQGDITYNQLFAFIVHNGVYDRINMNTFNFVRAVYDELLFRLPTQQEFDVAFDMVELNKPGVVFGRYGSNRDDFVDALTESPAMMEGLILWTFQLYLNRFPTPQELVTLLPVFIENRDIRYVIQQIAVTDEYASFK